MENQNYPATKNTEIRLARRSPNYWRVTFDNPPLNIFGPETIPQLNEIITALETDVLQRLEKRQGATRTAEYSWRA